MSEENLEQYRAALRAGHLAGVRGDVPAALEAYRAAASLAPERALAFVGAARVLLDAGRAAEALATFDAALTRAPSDEAALAGRAEALWALGRAPEAATVLDRLAMMAEASGRLLDAADALGRGLELQESQTRRSELARIVLRLRSERPESGASESLADALRVLERPPVSALGGQTFDMTASGVRTTSEPPAERAWIGNAPIPSSSAAAAAAAAANAAETARRREERIRRAQIVEQAAEAIESVAFAAIEEAMGDAAPRPPGAPVKPPTRPPDLDGLQQVVVEALERLGVAGMEEAALDLGARALAIFPGSTRLHLELVRLYLSRRWEGAAAEKLLLLERLASLDGDEATRREIVRLASALHEPAPSTSAPSALASGSAPAVS